MQQHKNPFALATRIAVLTLASVAFLTTNAFAQQTYVSRYDVFAGYTFLSSPSIDLFENGVHFQIGVRPKTWYSLGFDYSNAAGDLTLTPDLLPDALQANLGAQMQRLAAAGLLPPGYKLAVKARSKTQTFAAGPQLAIRNWKAITPFIRPSIGLIREVATPKPGDAIAKGVVAQLAPEGDKKDTVIFWGVGGGVDFNVSRHMAIRVQADFVYDHLFDEILKNGRNTVRFSVSPAWNFGRNIASK